MLYLSLVDETEFSQMLQEAKEATVETEGTVVLKFNSVVLLFKRTKLFFKLIRWLDDENWQRQVEFKWKPETFWKNKLEKDMRVEKKHSVISRVYKFHCDSNKNSAATEFYLQPLD